MFKWFVDPGHGGRDSGAVGNGLQEKNVTLAIAKKIKTIAEREYEGVQVRLSRSSDVYLSLSERTRMANSWGADLFTSVHINAGGGTGFESFIYNGNYSSKAQTDRVRSFVHDEIVKQTGFLDRGKKQANFHVLRETRMTAHLTENGFIDNASDASKLKSDAFLEKIARGHVLGAARVYGWKRKSSGGSSGGSGSGSGSGSSGTFYRVITGSFKNRSNAEKRQQKLKKAGFDSFLDAYSNKGETFYRVVTGSFKNRSNAEKRQGDLKQKGFDSFIDVYKK
ncbi:N-acetylmuramoyl-L-alanine amidase [Camelliibacillus cellulosilyticus]|uniref:N-acetylmuramoyl-L-alanine amidase n=1 Tax=Camelliibacillus cellulosilyticus TaxID=2174486 RepID=A0ABV9GPS2_9BACL